MKFFILFWFLLMIFLKKISWKNIDDEASSQLDLTTTGASTTQSNGNVNTNWKGDTSTQMAVKSSTQNSKDSTSESAVKLTTKSSEKTSTKSITDSTTKSTAKSTTTTSEKPSTKTSKSTTVSSDVEFSTRGNEVLTTKSAAGSTTETSEESTRTTSEETSTSSYKETSTESNDDYTTESTAGSSTASIQELTTRAVESSTNSGKETSTRNSDVSTTESTTESTSESSEEPSTISGKEMSTIGGKETSTISGREMSTISGKETSTISGKEMSTTSGRETSTISGRETSTISGKETSTISGRETSTISGKETSTISGKETSTISGKETSTISGRETSTISDKENSTTERTTDSTTKTNEKFSTKSIQKPTTMSKVRSTTSRNEDSSHLSSVGSTAKTNEDSSWKSTEKITINIGVELSSKNKEDLTTKGPAGSTTKTNKESSTKRTGKTTMKSGVKLSTAKLLGTRTTKDNFLAKCCENNMTIVMRNSSGNEFYNFTKNIEILLESTTVNKTTTFSGKDYVAMLFKSSSTFNGVVFYANESQAGPDESVSNPTVVVELPGDLNISSQDMIVFIVLKLSELEINGFPELNDNRVVGLSVSNRKITGLKKPVKINMTYSEGLNKTIRPQCVFLNHTSQALSTEGCQTEWEYGQHRVICSCDHFTYFGILMVSSSLSSTDLRVLSYITEIGCSISLFFLVVAVLVFFTSSKIRVDDSKRIHISLAIALVLLNLHFLTTEMAAGSSSPGLCLYVALAIHYSLLATFCWMALEGFHLYLLIIKVFNIHINRYMVKISVVGWGVPGVIVLVLLSINKDFYGRYTFVDSSNSTSTAICYITNENVKGVTTVGVFALMFLFVTAVFSITVRNMMPNCCQREFRQKNWRGFKQNVCTGLVLFTLLGITWGLVFFSFGQLTTPGLYLFCILNSLQGFFIFLYFVLSLRKIRDIKASPSKRPSSTNSLDILD